MPMHMILGFRDGSVSFADQEMVGEILTAYYKLGKNSLADKEDRVVLAIRKDYTSVKKPTNSGRNKDERNPRVNKKSEKILKDAGMI